ncbi:SH3 domain-containing protein [Camelimonas abortus]|uniref:SH3 domain-containing protein n=1 Tax=Camelimonas abortus TaxID=1017184 RepID=A0ABV7LFK3_9HYPH
MTITAAGNGRGRRAARRRTQAARVAPVAGLLAALALSLAAAQPAAAVEAVARGTVTGLPLPRYVSLKSDRVNLRRGPGKDHATVWIYQRAGLPVEITAEFETWRRVRDSEGVEGWVLHSLLSGKRTGLVTPWEKEGALTPMRRAASDDAGLVARLAPRVIVQVEKCDGTWCEVEVRRRRGYVRQERLWGVYPGEVVN